MPASPCRTFTPGTRASATTASICGLIPIIAYVLTRSFPAHRLTFLQINNLPQIGIIGGTTSTTVASTGTKTTTGTTTTTTGNGVTTPLPTQSGMVTNCAKFYKTKQGQGCFDVTNENGITLPDFYAWNKGIGETCSNMWADTWYCVGLIGQTTTKPPTTASPTKTTTTSSTTTTKGNGISTPTPTQPGGMTPNCDKFYLVSNGESCSDLLKKNGLTMAQFYALNPGVLDDCRGMWGGVYVCVHAFK